MSTKTRRATRRTNLHLPHDRWPLVHNAMIARAKKLRKWDGFRGHPTFYVHLDEHHDLTKPSPLDTITRQHQIAEQYRTLDTLAALGWDTRDEHDALAAEEAELWMAEL